MKRKYQFPPTPEEVEFMNSLAVNALSKRIAEVVNQTDDLEPPDIVWILLWSAQNYICVHEEDENFLKAAKILHSMTRKLTKARWGVTLDGEVQDLSTGEKFSPTRQ
jgi:hypothetical protein